MCGERGSGARGAALEQRTVDAVRRLGLARPRDLTRLGLRRE